MPLDKTQTVGVRPMQGTFGISGARIVAAGDSDGSVLYYRTAKLGGGRMPRLGSSLVDERAIKLIHIGSRPCRGATTARAPPTQEGRAFRPEETAPMEALRAGCARLRPPAPAAIRSLTDSTRTALALMRLLDQRSVPDAVRQEVIAVAKITRGGRFATCSNASCQTLSACSGSETS